VTTHPPRNLMQREPLFQPSHNAAPSLLQRLRRTMWSHQGTPFRDASNVLHYLCGCQ
jgi:hypothetical protein